MSDGKEKLSEEVVIELDNITFSYNGIPALSDINLRIRDGEFLSMVGPNGGGKTTLLKVILGLLIPESGSVKVFGKSPRQVRNRIGYTPQHAHYDPKFPVTVIDVVLMGCVDRCFGGRYSQADKLSAVETLEEMDIVDLANKPFNSISGGERQRALVARSLISKPDLLLLDEPTSNMDFVVGNKLLEILRDLNRRMTIIMVSHDFGFVSSIVSSVLCVNRTAVIHPTSEITGDIINEMYGGEYLMIRHDHRCAEEGHTHA